MMVCCAPHLEVSDCSKQAFLEVQRNESHYQHEFQRGQTGNYWSFVTKEQIDWYWSSNGYEVQVSIPPQNEVFDQNSLCFRIDLE